MVSMVQSLVSLAITAVTVTRIRLPGSCLQPGSRPRSSLTGHTDAFLEDTRLSDCRYMTEHRRLSDHCNSSPLRHTVALKERDNIDCKK